MTKKKKNHQKEKKKSIPKVDKGDVCVCVCVWGTGDVIQNKAKAVLVIPIKMFSLKKGGEKGNQE